MIKPSHNYSMLFLLCTFFASCYSKEARVKKQIETWKERTRGMVPDTPTATERARDSLARINRHGQGIK